MRFMRPSAYCPHKKHVYLVTLTCMRFYSFCPTNLHLWASAPKSLKYFVSETWFAKERRHYCVFSRANMRISYIACVPFKPDTDPAVEVCTSEWPDKCWCFHRQTAYFSRHKVGHKLGHYVRSGGCFMPEFPSALPSQTVTSQSRTCTVTWWWQSTCRNAGVGTVNHACSK